jgi:hypothetical protein
MSDNRYSFDNSKKISSSNFDDDVQFVNDNRILRLEQGHAIECRILRFSDKLSSRKTPWIVKTLHSVFEQINDDASTDQKLFTSRYVTCPSTRYLGVKEWKEKCKICKFVDELFLKLNSSDLSKFEKQIIQKTTKTLKRKWKTFIPVYIINDSLSKENNGKSKVLMFNNFDTGARLEKFFKFREDSSNFFNSFTTTGQNFKIEVSQDNIFEIKFYFAAAKPLFSETEFNQESFIEQHIKPLKFDEEFYNDYSEETCEEFYSKYVVPLVEKFRSHSTSNATLNTTSKTQQNNEQFVYGSQNNDELQFGPNDNSTETVEQPKHNDSVQNEVDKLFPVETEKTITTETTKNEPEKEVQPQPIKQETKTQEQTVEVENKDDVKKNLDELDEFLKQLG